MIQNIVAPYWRTRPCVGSGDTLDEFSWEVNVTRLWWSWCSFFNFTRREMLHSKGITTLKGDYYTERELGNPIGARKNLLNDL